MSEDDSWQCPYCGNFATLRDRDRSIQIQHLFDDASEGMIGFAHRAVRCPNPKCRKLALEIILGTVEDTDFGYEIKKAIQLWQLRPESSAKPQPDCVPRVLQDDYREACLIRDKSPKASATLARRCLQGMIRDFWGIKKARLIDEVDALEQKVDPDVWAAIKAVKDIGNIGAHMEKDINVILEVEPSEAQLLIELIEQLFKEWYVARHQRQQRMAAVTALAQAKKPGNGAAPTPEPAKS
jgi:hypothetical protein